MARPSTYNAKLHPKLIHALAKQGFTDEQIAAELEMSTGGLYKWYKQYPELVEAKKTGAKDPDDLVEIALFDRALGYTWEEEQAVRVKKDKDSETVEVVKIRRKLPPDATSMIFWLKNRRPDKWRDKREDLIPTTEPPMRIHISGNPNPDDLDVDKNDNLEISKGHQ